LIEEGEMAKDYLKQIKKYSTHSELEKLWAEICSGGVSARHWAPGKAFEHLLLRAFELEGAEITWPYHVSLFGMGIIEQIDGAIYLPTANLTVLVESKDLDDSVNVEPITKLRNQLMRRPSGLIGAVFTTSTFSEPAVLLTHFLAPQTILLWEKNHIEFCLKNQKFIPGMLAKYKDCLEKGKPDLDITTGII
jgi:hypothetical protein